MSLDQTPEPNRDVRPPAAGMLHVANLRDVLAGLLFIAIGIATVVGAIDYPLGTMRNIGPGYYPILLGIALVLLGGGVAFAGFRTGQETAPAEDEGGLALRPLIMVITAVVAFGLLVRPFGLGAAVVSLIVISSFAGREFSIVRVVLLCIGMAALSWLVFIYVLGLNMSMWPR